MLLNSKFRPAWWLRNPHAQTLWAAKLQRNPTPVITTERLETSDGDFLDLSWTEQNNLNDNSPIVVIFHGLAGSVKSHYARSLMHYLDSRNVRAVLMHFRGCSGVPNRTPGSYHSGHTTDISFTIDNLTNRYQNAPIAAAGFSLGGNALLKYLAKNPTNPLKFAVSVSPPLVLAEGAKRMNQGFSRLYQHTLMVQMKEAVRLKHQHYPEFGLDKLDFENTRTFVEFDHQVTAPLHSYSSAADYYRRASSLGDLIKIKTPTHILWSRDDPFFTEVCIPTEEKLSDAVDFELTTHGGHVAFISGSIPFAGMNWLTARVGALLIDNICSYP